MFPMPLKPRIRLYVLALMLLCSLTARTQDIPRSVIASAGQEQLTGKAGLSWTLGEIFSETLELNGNTYAMGFQQAFVQVRQHPSPPGESIATVFPNPFAQHLVIQPYRDLGPALVSIYSVTGSKVFESELQLDGRQTIGLSFLPDGAYILHIRSGTVQSFMILKNKQ